IECPVQRRIAVGDQGGAVHMDGRARHTRDRRERDAVARKGAVLEVEAGHRTVNCTRRASNPLAAPLISFAIRPFSSMSSDPVTTPSTDELIERCLRGDQAAWEQIVRQHWRKVFNLAYKFVGRHDEAEDLAQDIFLKIFRALHTFDRRANFQTWLISISRNF